ncbi:MAB_1171c family putative transporter [Amycolatopsis rhizosphaerae]|nr:MAB_1171c family putative transporter [Amycolatopsis rhizosphaerae]
MWLAATIAALWKISQLARAPHDKGLRAVTACTVLVLIALSAQLVVSVPGVAGRVSHGLPKLIQNVILTFFFALLIVLLQAAIAPARAGMRGYTEVGLALLTSVALTAAFVATTPGARGASYQDAGGFTGALVFYLIGNLYMAYATSRGAYLAWAAAERSHSQARLSLRVAAVGLMVCCLGTHVPRVVAVAGGLTLNVPGLLGVAVWTTPLLAIGISVFCLGIGYPGARTGAMKARLWLEARRQHRQLRPLWLAVTTQFPNIALFPPDSALREAFRVRQMRLRLYRRVIECRDGLVCLSPFVEEPIDVSQPPERQSKLIGDALVRSAQGKEIGTTMVLAAPRAAGMEADTRELLALSRALGGVGRGTPSG